MEPMGQMGPIDDCVSRQTEWEVAQTHRQMDMVSPRWRKFCLDHSTMQCDSVWAKIPVSERQDIGGLAECWSEHCPFFVSVFVISPNVC